MRVTAVTPGGPADRAGVRVGDELVSLAGTAIRDAVDLAFAIGWTDEEEGVFGFRRGGEPVGVTLPVTALEELGFELEEPPARACGNRCVFCFVDQLPRGLRSSLYFKDEDYRLSFSHGNYITLTNLSDEDYDRIAKQRLSPLYVSVHATDDGVRRELLGSPGAPPVVESLQRLGSAGVRVHTQIVVCPGMNDGAVLENTLADLAGLGDTVLSVAVVPVGLTEHREGLPEVAAVTSEGARDVLATVERWQATFTGRGRPRTVYAADELYLLAGRELPPHEDYDEFPQLENGVGLLRSFEAELNESAGAKRKRLEELLARRPDGPLAVTLVTGKLACGFLRAAVGAALGAVEGLSINVVAAGNSLFGASVTVAGLLSGADMAEALAAAPPAELNLVPAVAFNTDGLTVDDMTLADIAERARRQNVVATDDLVGALLEHLDGVGRTGPGDHTDPEEGP